MSRIKNAGTRPEKLLRRMVRELSGRAIRCNVRRLPGSPDIVVPSLRLAIFMDGCFWHACPAHGSTPKSRRVFWSEKLRRNVLRDRRSRRELRKAGWKVWSIWEHDLRKDSLSRTRRNLRKRLARMVGSKSCA